MWTDLFQQLHIRLQIVGRLQRAPGLQELVGRGFAELRGSHPGIMAVTPCAALAWLVWSGLAGAGLNMLACSLAGAGLSMLAWCLAGGLRVFAGIVTF